MNRNVHALNTIQTHDPSSRVAHTHTPDNAATVICAMSYCRKLSSVFFNKAYQLIPKQLENQIVYYKETGKCWHLMQ
jgi:hypothetical protein